MSDGAYIAFQSERDGDIESYVMEANGSNPRNISHSTADDWNPHWSADGSRITYETDRDGNWEIYLTDICGLSATRLTNNNALDTLTTWR